MDRKDIVMTAESLGTEGLDAKLDALEATGRHVAEPKYDGWRALITIKEGKVASIESRKGTKWRHRFPELVEAFPSALRVQNGTFDGELGCLEGDNLRMDISKLQGRPPENLAGIRLHRLQHEVTFVAFDVLILDGRDLTTRPLEERRRALEAALTPNPRIRIAPQFTQLRDAYERVLRMGGEGVMLKDRTSTYARGTKSKAWLKAKAIPYEDNYEVVGFWSGNGKRHALGSLILGSYDAAAGGLVYVTKAGSGLGEDDIDAIVEAAKTLTRPDCPLLEAPPPEPGHTPTWLEPGIWADIKWEKPQPEGTQKPHRGPAEFRREQPRFPRVISIDIRSQ